MFVSVVEPRINFAAKDGSPVPFRYAITPNAQVNVFEPKQLTAEASRASMIGASMMIAGFEKYPLDGNIVKQLWEACSANSVRIQLLWLFEYMFV